MKPFCVFHIVIIGGSIKCNREEIVAKKMELGDVVEILSYVQVNEDILVLVPKSQHVIEQLKSFGGMQWVLC